MMDNYLFSSYHLSDENIPHYINKIKQINPVFLDTSPSAIQTVANFMNENGIDGIYPKAIITTGETLLDYQREVIEKVFQCPVFDQYGCAEQAVFISQCEKGQYHMHPEHGIVEILNDNGEEVKEGEVGEIVCTSFTNDYMPLIRYAIGDYAMKGASTCSCGRKSPLIKRIYGRKVDCLTTPDGKKITRLSPCFKGLTSIKAAQIIQNSQDKIDVLIVPGKNYTSANGDVLLNHLQDRIGELMEIKLSLVDDIPKTKSGKFKLVVSKIKTNK